MSALVSIVVIAVAIYLQNPLALLAFIPIIVLEIIGTNYISKSDKALFMPISVYIDTEEETIVQKSEKRETFCMLDYIATVEDHGEWYNFTFEYGHGNPYFVCQKALLAQGTIEDFEALFEGKIVRMN